MKCNNSPSWFVYDGVSPWSESVRCRSVNPENQTRCVKPAGHNGRHCRYFRIGIAKGNKHVKEYLDGPDIGTAVETSADLLPTLLKELRKR